MSETASPNAEATPEAAPRATPPQGDPAQQGEVRTCPDLDIAFDLDRRLTYEVAVEPMPYWFQFLPKGRGLPLIVVSPHAMDRNGGAPKFLRGNWLRQLPYNVLLFKDPTLFLSPKLRMGWCLGTTQRWPVKDIADVVGRLRDQLGIDNRNIVFMGFAAGGFTSFQLAAQLKGSSALLNNPDIRADGFRQSNLNLVLTHGYEGLSLDEARKRYAPRFSLSETLKAADAVPRVFCLQHMTERAQISDQLLPLFDPLTAPSAAGAQPDEEEDEKLVVAYYMDDRGHNRSATGTRLRRALEQIRPWFIAPSMAPPVAASPAAPEAPRVSVAPEPPQAPSPHMAAQPAPSSEEPLDAVAYWTGVLSGTHGEPDAAGNFRARVEGRSPVPEPIVKLLERLDLARAKILDVGAGPHTLIGPRLYGSRLNIIAVDPQAEAYDGLLSAHGLKPFIRTIKGDSDTLVEQFGRNRFDIVHARDALDHVMDPWSAIQQMIHVCVPGGAIHIAGSAAERSNRQGSGLERWSFMPVETDLVIWNTKGARLASQALTGITHIRATATDAGFICTLFKQP